MRMSPRVSVALKTSAALILLTLIAAAGLALLVSQKENLAIRNAETSQNGECNHSGVVGQTTILLDVSDPLSPSQQRTIIQYIEDVLARQSEGARISLHFVDAINYMGLSDPLFDDCAPRRGEGASFLNENPRFIEQHYWSTFREPFMDQLRMQTAAQPTDASPILEALADIAALPANSKGKSPLSLIIVSDMLQHSKAWSQYKNGNDFSAFYDQLNRKGGVQNLQQAEISILYVLRPEELGGRIQGEQHQAFWRLYFENAGAAKIYFQSVR